MPRQHRSRKNKTQQARVATLGVELLRTLDAWSKIVNDWDGTCAYCGKKPPKGVKLTRDHVIPISAGGSDGLENVVPACKLCNEKKGSQFWEPLVKPSERRTITGRTPSNPVMQQIPIKHGHMSEPPSSFAKAAGTKKQPRSREKIIGAGLKTMQDALQGAIRGEE